VRATLAAVNSRRLGITVGAVAYTLWGLFPIYFHHLAPAPAGEVLAHRMVWTLAITAGFLAIRRRWDAFDSIRRDRKVLRRVALGAMFLLGNWSTYIWAVGHDRVVEAALGYFITPLASVAIGVVVLGERLRRLQIGAVALGSVAVVVLTIGYGKPPVVSLILAFSFSLYGYFKKTVDIPAVVALCLETMLMMPVGLVVGGLLIARNQTTFSDHGNLHAVMLLLAGVITAVPLILFGVAARRVPLTMIGLLQYITPVMQMLCGVVVFHEIVPIERWVGFCIVWGALGLLVADALSQRGDHESDAGQPGELLSVAD
jgi:chloramphenicol-sensitive protein RarD